MIMGVSKLVISIVLIGLFLEAEGACYQKHGCVYSGHAIAPGESYTSTIDCIRCSCYNGNLSCCSLGGYIADHPPECKVVKDGCSEKAVLASDENKPCPGPVSMVGR